MATREFDVPSQSQLGPLFRDEHAPLSDRQAVIEASACLQCGGPCAAAPCVSACPAGIDIPAFIHDIADQRPIDAAATIFADNVLGGTCARVCPVEVLCEGSCVLLKEGRRAIHIGRLQRYATDQAFAAGVNPLKTDGVTRKSQSVAVIGAGPAGLACAAELAKLGYPVVVYERREFPGGLVTRGIAPYKQQFKPLPEEVEQIRELGVEFRFGVCIGKDVSVETLRAQHQAIFLGVGMGDDMPARVPGENLAGVWESLRFIETIKLAAAKGLALGRRVAVIGGGNTAIDVAREAVLLRNSEVTSGNTAIDVAREAVMLGASEVMMLYRRSEAEMPAFAHEITAAKREGVRIVPLVAPVEFVGNGRVTGVRCVRMKLGAPDSSGRPRPEPIPGSEFLLEVDTVIKAIGQKPHTDLFSLLGVQMNGTVVQIDKAMRASAPGVYAGGDAVNGGATVVQAVHDGRQAARTIDRDLSRETAPLPLAKPQAYVERSVDGTIRHFQADFRLTTAPRLCKGCNVCVTTCPTHTLKLDAVNQIAVNDPGTCVFCGLCEARCPDFAIWIVKGQSERARTPAPEGELVS
jgi:glutamate synthase (NADPH/NADH) small chain